MAKSVTLELQASEVALIASSLGLMSASLGRSVKSAATPQIKDAFNLQLSSVVDLSRKFVVQS